MQQFSTWYTIKFSLIVCVICSLLVSASAVVLKERQDQNILLDRQKNVLKTAGLMAPGQSLSREEVIRLFEQNFRPMVIELKTGTETKDNPATFDQQAEAKNPATSFAAPPNEAGVLRLPNRALVYKVMKDGKLTELIVPVEGKGLWSTLYGYLALRSDGTTIGGITFYQHGETPGLGGEVDNPKWQALWPGRKAFDEQGEPKIEVIKGHAGSVEQDPHRIDGLSGATITSRGVSHFVRFWLSDDGFGPYLKTLRKNGELKGG